jgi:hemin uptake protein HemP
MCKSPAHDTAQGPDPGGAQDPSGPAGIASADLLQGRRELLIHHAGQTYRLRLTASNKLILVK